MTAWPDFTGPPPEMEMHESLSPGVELMTLHYEDGRNVDVMRYGRWDRWRTWEQIAEHREPTDDRGQTDA